MLPLVAADSLTMASLCSVCLHIDESMEYSNGGAMIVQVCMFNHANFNLVKRYDQCRDFTDENRQEAEDADTDLSQQFSGPACGSDDRPGADAPN